MKQEAAVSIFIDNLPSIAVAYSGAVVSHVLFEVWKRLSFALTPKGIACSIEAWGVSLRSARKSGHGIQLEIEDLLNEISATPIFAGCEAVVVALSVQSSSHSHDIVVSAAVNADQYKKDMAEIVAIFSLLMNGRMRFAAEVVANSSGAGQSLYYECLLRLEDANGRPVFPGSFLPLIERLGLTRPVDRKVVRSVIAELRKRSFISLGCNISGLSACNDVWWNSIINELRREPDVARRLVIEITETAAPPSSRGALELIAALRRTGCKIALDDFGAGYSSIAFARAASPDIVKVDSSFLRVRKRTPREPDLLRNLVALAGNLAPHVVVEGVETYDDLRLVAQSGANWCQGFLFKQPLYTPPAAQQGNAGGLRIGAST